MLKVNCNNCKKEILRWPYEVKAGKIFWCKECKKDGMQWNKGKRYHRMEIDNNLLVEDWQTNTDESIINLLKGGYQH